jgi:hypothetical protein
MFADAGFSLARTGETDKIIIRELPSVGRTDRQGNDVKSDVHSVTIDPNRSKAYTANLIWGLASE